MHNLSGMINLNINLLNLKIQKYDIWVNLGMFFCYQYRNIDITS